jgi:chromosome segregation ATPase
MQVQELSRSTEEKLSLLNALAEHVNQKTKALDGQRQTLDRAVIEANRLNEMVWSMDVQVEKLREGMKEVARSEETIAHIERLAEETEQRFDLAQKVRHELTRDVARFERDGRALVDTMKGMLESLALERHQFETFNQRVRALQAALEAAESRVGVLDAQQQHLGSLHQQVTALRAEFQGMAAQADTIAARQAGLDRLEERLNHVDELARQTSVRFDVLWQSRAELEAMRRDIQDVHRAQLEAAQIRDRLAADRAAIEAFDERITALRASAPRLEAEIDALLSRLGHVESGSQEAQRLAALIEQLEAQLTRMTGRVEFVTALEERVNALHAVRADVDRRLDEQLARRAEIDGLRVRLEGLGAQLTDAQRKADAVAEVQHRLMPLEERVGSLASVVNGLARSVDEVRRDDAALVDRRAHLEALLEQSRALAADIERRIGQAETLSAQVERASSTKEQLLASLSAIERQQREAMAQADAAVEYVQRVDAMHSALEQRREALLFSERRLEGVEARLLQVLERSDGLADMMRSLQEREALVLAVKAEVEQIYQISQRSRADLQHVAEGREELAGVRQQLDTLLATAADAEDKIAAIEGRRTTIDAVHGKATLIANLLEDVRVNLETLGEQKAVIDHVAVKLARLDFMMQEAQNTLRALQHERELAERIEQNIAQLRARTALGPDAKGVATA